MRFWLEVIGMMMLCLIFFALVFCFALFGIEYLDYIWDQSLCTVKVNNEEVYSGRAHFVSINSIGENGNTKKVTVYNDKFCLHPVKHYVSEKVEVE